MDDLRDAAVATLRANDAGEYTLPSRRTYPHQWGWDSAFCALGWAEIDPDRAYTELESLLGGRNVWGAISQIAFREGSDGYEPGPQRWGDLRAADGRRTTAITQPPVAATCLRLLHVRCPDPERARRLLGVLHACHRALFDRRDPGTGLPVLIHPWESGRDNAAEWDGPLRRVRRTTAGFVRRDTEAVDPGERPSDEFYAASYSLIDAGRRSGWDQRSLAVEGEFRVLDPGFLAILARAAWDLADLAAELGEPDIADGARTDSALVCVALDERADDDGLIWPEDLRAGERCRPVGTAAALSLLLPVLSDERIVRLSHLVTHGELSTPFGVRSLSPNDPAYEPRRYWRGPCWWNITWLCALGLAHHGERDAADLLRERLLSALAHAGLREYCTDDGEGLGARDFSWTAALCLWELPGERGVR